MSGMCRQSGDRTPPKDQNCRLLSNAPCNAKTKSFLTVIKMLNKMLTVHRAHCH